LIFTRKGKQLITAIIFASFTSTGIAAAAPQSTRQILETSRPRTVTSKPEQAGEQKVVEQPSVTATPKTAAPQAETPIEIATVVPPAPNVIKQINPPVAVSTDSTKITILSDDATAEPNAEANNVGPTAEVKKPAPAAEAKKLEPKYTEHPVISNVTVGSRFGYRSDPFTGRAKFHTGLDIKAHQGDPVGASQPGIVQYAGWYHGYGNIVIINHGGGVTTHYAHLSSFDIMLGARVERGQIIGRAGSTGRATSPHLHYEVRLNGNPINPLAPLALDPLSDYFKLMPTTVATPREEPRPSAQPMRVN
jgi:murein DD-endopeptidase MepM/ murein hydrolase activator NlpD